MLTLTNALKEYKDFDRLLSRLDERGFSALLSGFSAIHKAHIIAALHRCTGRTVVAVCPDELECERIGEDSAVLSASEHMKLFSREFTFVNVESVSRQTEHERISTLYSLASNRASIIMTTPDALMQRTMPVATLMSSGFRIKTGDRIEPDNAVRQLLACGYKRYDQVEGMGQFAKRGGILDFFSPAFPYPVRCEFFGDEIDSLGFFDPSSQRRLEESVVETDIEILPAAECLAELYNGNKQSFFEELNEYYTKLLSRKNALKALSENVASDISRLENAQSIPWADRYIELIYPEFQTAADYLPDNAIIVLCEPSKLEERVKNYIWRQNQDIESLLENGRLDASLLRFTRDWDECCDLFKKKSPIVMMDSFRAGKYPVSPSFTVNINTKSLPSYGGSLPTAAGDIVHYLKESYRVAVLAPDERKAVILKEYLEETGIPCALDFFPESLPCESKCVISIGALSQGMEYSGIKLAILTEGQLRYVPAPVRQTKKAVKNRQRLQSYADLSPGDLIVHEHHGIGRFVGIFKIPVDGVEKDYIKIAYLGSDSLYVPATQLDMVSKYIGGGEERQVRLHKLGGSEWQKAKSRAKGAAKELAAELIKLYAERSKRPGFAFSPDSAWLREFEDSFEYTETSDQLRAIAEIKKDMEKAIPMDRLLCGDVGFGKTEVALRAVMKCVLDGKQSAILVPTTVLAQQHFVTALRRFANYPMKIAVLSRFTNPAQMKKALKDIKNGAVDIVIGTHRIIQKDVEFKDLGLLVVDEEQRFGVSHKEKLKGISKQVDVLTLSATPIPRTLNMALSGIRDMSSIEEAPTGRHPVQTYVLEHDWAVLCDAVRREISRGGQVYYLHNRVETIDRTASRLASMLEGISVAAAHGQMNEEALSAIMEKVSSGEIQVLICTTIIETGIDIPNVNTLIIEDADRLGLAQLHQIRGRVGRSSRHAFAYFTFRPGKVLSEIATKRLLTIREFTEFNSGFKIAMRDLEIRGAGNLLGAEQSGHMLSVGYDMYLKLLEEAVLEEKGEKTKKRAECSADLTVSANIPEDYVQSPEQRMDLYRRIAFIENEEDADDITDELIDRFGEPPKSVITLISVALLRGEAASAGFSEITQKGGRLYFKLIDFNMAKISELYNRVEFRGKIKVEAGTVPALSLKLNSGQEVIREAVSFVRAYGSSDA